MKRFLATLLIVISCVPFCGAQEISAIDGSTDSLRLMSYNVGAFRKWEKNSIPLVAGIIEDSGASFVAMQEVDRKVIRSGYVHQPRKLAQMLTTDSCKWNWAFGRAIKILSGSYGNAVVWKDCGPSRTHRIAIPKGNGSEKRCCLIVETPLCVFASIHLDYKSEDAAMEGLRLVTEYAESHYSDSCLPVFLCGDFNFEPGSEVIKSALESWTLVSDPSLATFPCNPSRPAVKTIDYVFLLKNGFASGSISPTVLYGGPDGPQFRASDHFPVLVTVPLK